MSMTQIPSKRPARCVWAGCASANRPSSHTFPAMWWLMPKVLVCTWIARCFQRFYFFWYEYIAQRLGKLICFRCAFVSRIHFSYRLIRSGWSEWANENFKMFPFDTDAMFTNERCQLTLWKKPDLDASHQVPPTSHNSSIDSPTFFHETVERKWCEEENRRETRSGKVSASGSASKNNFSSPYICPDWLYAI